MYWCLECGQVLEKELLERGFKCGHWSVCGRCEKESGYLTLEEIIEKICSNCELGFEVDECPFRGDFKECPFTKNYVCPFYPNVSECPKIREWKKSSSHL
jgi:hypothetical protein